MHRPSKALEGYSLFKTTDLRDPVLGEIAERQGGDARAGGDPGTSTTKSS